MLQAHNSNLNSVLNVSILLCILQAHETSKAALDKAKEAHQAAEEAVRRPCSLHQPYWCEGVGDSVSALEAWLKAGLPFRAVVHLKAPEEGTQPKGPPPLIAGKAMADTVTDIKRPASLQCLCAPCHNSSCGH